MVGFRNGVGKKVRNDLQEKASGFISKKLEKLKARLANRLGLIERRLTPPQKKICLLIFCVCMGSIYAGLLIQGIFIHNNRIPVFLQKSSINTPLNTVLPDSLDIKWLKELQRINKMSRALKDSLKNKTHLQ